MSASELQRSSEWDHLEFRHLAHDVNVVPMTKNVFVIYPSQPSLLQNAIEGAIEELEFQRPDLRVESWRQIGDPGRFIVEGVMQRIDDADFIVADITRLNFNVTFEVGYAIGRTKPVALTINEGLSPGTKEITELGVYDTLLYDKYQNAVGLSRIISGIDGTEPLHFPAYEIDRSAPVYVLDTLHKGDASLRIASKLRQAKIGYRSFDPAEKPRLSTLEAYGGVARSVAVIINLLSAESTDYELNNLRGAFLAGLSFGLDTEPLIVQEGEDPVPLDYRDFVEVYRHPFDVDPHINDLAPRVMESVLTSEGRQSASVEGFLANMDFGDSTAENEIETLGDYYVATDEFGTVLDGLARLTVGRKGSGKSALFFQVRDNLRRSKGNLILDLKPEGHQLLRFKHQVLQFLEEGVREFVVTAFWEYILLLETCNKILESDRQLHIRNRDLTEPYQRLKELYTPELLGEELDFSERLLELVDRIGDRFLEKYGEQEDVYLTQAQVTELIYAHDIPQLRQQLAGYLQYKDRVTVLFDNLDKGWPTRGVTETDIVILRALLEASRKLERFFNSRNADYTTTVFVRNDVYELLVEETPDRGKESRVSLDWTDPDLLKEFLRRRLVFNGIDAHLSFREAWQQVCVTHIEGEDTADHLIQRSLMRPRNFLTLVNHCKSNAVNLQHDKIAIEDIQKASAAYSADLCKEIGLEIRDVFPAAEDVPYYFIGASSPLTLSDVKALLEEVPITNEQVERLIEILLWFGFLGVQSVRGDGNRETYIYDVHYDMKKLKRLARNLRVDDTVLFIHRAFWPFLDIEV
jgi:nucleoside 2-deoxyribosyltransferase